jgi:transposase, IS5 family
LTSEQVLRAVIFKRVKKWDLRELRERIADGITLRQFTDFCTNAMSKHQAFSQAFNRLTPETIGPSTR